MRYKAVYPTEAIEAHRAFIARRRAARPSEEYRTPTDDEWDEFLALPVTAEFVPFGVGDGPVFVGWAQGAAAGDEVPVGVDGLLGIDRVVVHRDVDLLVVGEQLADVRRHAVGDRLGDEGMPCLRTQRVQSCSCRD